MNKMEKDQGGRVGKRLDGKHKNRRELLSQNAPYTECNVGTRVMEAQAVQSLLEKRLLFLEEYEAWTLHAATNSGSLLYLHPAEGTFETHFHDHPFLRTPQTFTIESPDYYRGSIMITLEIQFTSTDTLPNRLRAFRGM